MEQKISVLVPFGGTNQFRIRVWHWLDRYWRSHLRDFEIIVGRDPASTKKWFRRHPKPFSKAVAVNDAFKRSRGDIIVILDADTYLDAEIVMHWARRLRAQRRAGVRSWAVPYRYLLRLNERATERLLETSPESSFPTTPPDDDVDAMDGSGWGHIYGALIQIMPREAFELVGGMDERFVGWGGEDQALLKKLDALWGRYQNSPNNVYHLWHPKIIAAQGTDIEGHRAEIRAWEGQETIRSNDWLSGLYNLAGDDPDKIRAVAFTGRRQHIWKGHRMNGHGIIWSIVGILAIIALLFWLAPHFR